MHLLQNQLCEAKSQIVAPLPGVRLNSTMFYQNGALDLVGPIYVICTHIGTKNEAHRYYLILVDMYSTQMRLEMVLDKSMAESNTGSGEDFTLLDDLFEGLENSIRSRELSEVSEMVERRDK